MPGRGFLKSHLAQMNGSAGPPKLIHSQDDVTSKVSVHAECNGFHKQENTLNIAVPEKCNGISKQNNIPKVTVAKQFNGIHKQDNVLKVTDLKECNGIHKQDNVPKVTVPVVSNGIIPQAVRGRRAIIDRMTEKFKLNINVTTGFSSTKPDEDTKNNVPQSLPPSYDDLPTIVPPVVCRVPEHSKKDTYKMTQLSANYMKIELDNSKGIYEYYVEFSPLIDVKSTKFYLLSQHKDILPVKIFDGACLFVPVMLPNKVTILKSKLKDESEVTLKISYKNKKSLNDCIKVYSIFLRNMMHTLGFVEFGRNNYDPDKKKHLPEFKLEVWPGYSAAINEFENGLYLCCDVSHRVLRVETVLETMRNITETTKNNGDVKQELKARLCSVVVITPYNNKTYRVDDVDFDMTPLSTFSLNGSEVSYVDYYKKMYDIQILDKKQPLLLSKLKKKDKSRTSIEASDVCCLIPELCNWTGLTEDMKNDFKLMKALQAHTVVDPDVRQRALVDLVSRINGHEGTKKKIDDWGLKFDLTPVMLEGPVYKRESIIMGHNIRKQVGVNMDWGLDVAKHAMFRVANLAHWTIVCTQKDINIAKSFCRQLSSCGGPLGMEISEPSYTEVRGINVESFLNSINIAVNKNRALQLIVIIFPNQREDRYNAVKRICCAQIGIPSQVIIARTLSKPERLRSITQKIALQINCKLGGACWSIEVPLENTMIIGIDVYHEKSCNAASYVGFVASLDKTFTKWISVATSQQNTHLEIISSLQMTMHKALNKYKEENGRLPQKIIVYRDGVSDGDLNNVDTIEIGSMEASFKSYSNDYCPMITYIIVQKRIHTRIFQFLDQKNLNPTAGTVVDNTITRRNYFDFFLVSQHVRQGTVTPSHYVVLKNGCNLSTENVQRLSYKLCHMYYNWCGTIKVPAPVQYAHKLAYLVGQNIKKMPSENLSSTLFYL